jgi:hypothetical protein
VNLAGSAAAATPLLRSKLGDSYIAPILEEVPGFSFSGNWENPRHSLFGADEV